MGKKGDSRPLVIAGALQPAHPSRGGRSLRMKQLEEDCWLGCVASVYWQDRTRVKPGPWGPQVTKGTKDRL